MKQISTLSKIPFLLIAILLFQSGACLNESNHKEKDNEDSTVHERKDSMGRVVERWGNYHTDDDNTNFREFYYYDENGSLVKEKRYSFEEDNSSCIIKDTAGYIEVKYTYKSGDNPVLEKIIQYTPQYDENGKFIERKLHFIKDVIRNVDLYRDDS